jgi:hypothetical protein
VNQQHALQLFERLVRNEPALKEWLQNQLVKQIDLLVMQNDEAQLRKAQGHAYCLQSLIRQLDDAKERLTR